MKVPIRKPGKYTGQKNDPHLTLGKFKALEKKLERLKKISRPRAIEELQKQSSMGDVSDNAAYSIAKGRLRGINERILEIEDHLKRAEIITPPDNKDVVVLGSRVIVFDGQKKKIYLILGPSETDPGRGIISHRSPLGSALLGRKVGDEVKIKLTQKEIRYKIIKIE